MMTKKRYFCEGRTPRYASEAISVGRMYMLVPGARGTQA